MSGHLLVIGALRKAHS